MLVHNVLCSFFFFNDTATTEIYTLSLHDALPILDAGLLGRSDGARRHRHLWDRVDPSHARRPQDRKSTRLNSSHSQISYAVFCLKKKKPPTLVFHCHALFIYAHTYLIYIAAERAI